MEATDACLGKVVARVTELGGVCLVTADHGNAEQLLEPDGVSPFTAHTTNPVPLIATTRGGVLRSGGELADLAPTVLTLLGVEIPPQEMSGKNLLTPGFETGFLSHRGVSWRSPCRSINPIRQLLRRAQRGDEVAFAEILRAYRAPVFNYVVRVVGNRSLAEDLTQEVFLRVFQGLPRFSQRCKFTTWLFQVTKNRVLDELRAQERRPHVAATLDDMPSLEALDLPEEQAETIDALWRAVEDLNPDLKMALLLRDVVGLSYNEIADSLEITLATVKWRIFKAREEVQLALAREGVSFDDRGRRSEPELAPESELLAQGEARRKRRRQAGARRSLPASARSDTRCGETTRCLRVEVEHQPGGPRVAVARLARPSRGSAASVPLRARPRFRRGEAAGDRGASQSREQAGRGCARRARAARSSAPASRKRPLPSARSPRPDRAGLRGRARRLFAAANGTRPAR